MKMTPREVIFAYQLLEDKKAVTENINKLTAHGHLVFQASLKDGTDMELALPDMRLLAALKEYRDDLDGQLAKMGVKE